MIQLSSGNWCVFHPTHPDLTKTETMWIAAAAFVCPKPRDVSARRETNHRRWRWNSPWFPMDELEQLPTKRGSNSIILKEKKQPV